MTPGDSPWRFFAWCVSGAGWCLSFEFGALVVRDGVLVLNLVL